MTLLLFYLFLAIGVSFLCSVLEAVLLSTTPSYVSQIQTQRPKAGQRLIQVRERLDESLSSILILNTFAHTMGAAGVGAQALHVFGPEWETLIAVALTLAILYFSEIIPKTLGATYWKSLAMPAAVVIHWLVKLVYPLVWLSTRLTQLFHHKHNDGISREEIIALAMLGHQHGTLVSQESQYLSNLLRLREIPTEHVLTPRSVVHMLHKDTTVATALGQSDTLKFSRIPVYDQNQDQVLGLVLQKDLYKAERNNQSQIPVEQLIVPIERVSEKLPVQPLLDRFIRQQAHLFLVEDEFGQTAGIVTLEDAIETLLGREIVDETDDVADMQALAKTQYRQRLRQQRQDDNSADGSGRMD